MRRFTERVAEKFQARDDNLVMTLESCDVVADGIIRVVGALNKMPNRDECESKFEAAFDNKLSCIKDSFRVKKEFPKVVISGYLKYVDERPLSMLERSESMKEISANVYMDNDDNSIWEIKGGKLLRNFDEDLTQLVSNVTCSPMTKGSPIEALASVKDFEGIDNTQYMAFVNPRTGEVSYGARVGDDHVFSAETGISEISQELVIDCKELKGEDKVVSLVESMQVTAGVTTDSQLLVDYYSKVYKYDPDYFVKIEDIIKKHSVV